MASTYLQGAANEVSLGENSLIALAVLVPSGVIAPIPPYTAAQAPAANPFIYQFGTTRGTVREDPNKILVTNAQSGGFTAKTRGPRDCVADGEMFWVPATNPQTNQPNFEPGTDCNYSIQIWPDAIWAPTVYYFFPVAYVTTVSLMIQGDGVQSFTFTVENQGYYSSPQRPYGS